MTFAYIALFVGMFIIYNTFSIIVAQRVKEMAMLRAIGAKRRQVLKAVLVESALVGLVASAAGLVAGVGMSYGLRALLGAVGLDIPSGSVVISTGTVTTAFVVGVGITVFSSLFPAIRASRVAPIAALRDSAVDRAATSVKRAVAGLAVLGGGVVLFAAGTIADGESTALLIGLGAALTIVGVFVSGPVIARPVMHVLGAVLPGTTGRLARENAKRNPRRSASTASALMIGVTLVGFITIVASSAKASINETVDQQLRADYVVESGAWDQGGFSPTLEGELAALPEVDAVVPLRSSPVVADGSTQELDAFDTTAIDEVFDLELLEGSYADVHGDGIAVSSTYATDHDLQLGDTLTLTFAATGDVDVTVDAIYDRTFGSGQSPFFVGLDTFEANVTDQYDRQLYVTTVDGVDAETSNAALTAALKSWPNADLQDHAAFKESVTKEIGTILNLIYGLLGLAVIIALIGIANTLALSVHERTRELGLLRAVGMTRRQVRSAIRMEAVLISLLGTALGFFLAVGGAWGVVTGQDAENVRLVIPGVQLAAIVGLAAVAGVIASLGPARRAAKLNVLAAIATA
jgi:putative ABC transport system permease protein